MTKTEFNKPIVMTKNIMYILKITLIVKYV